MQYKDITPHCAAHQRKLDGLKPSSYNATVSSKKTVLDVLFPRVRAELLRFALHTIQDELRKLNALGLIVTWSNGYHRFYRANQDHPLFESLIHIVRGSVKLPLPKQRLLRQPRRPRSAKQRTGQRGVPLPKDWPGKWNLFSNRRQT